eukprot:scaffold303188_cov15-Tisochrysis_lutea.AAC.1
MPSKQPGSLAYWLASPQAGSRCPLYATLFGQAPGRHMSLRHASSEIFHVLERNLSHNAVMEKGGLDEVYL